MLTFKLFKHEIMSWEKMAIEATEFANTIGPDKLVSISHSCDNSSGVIFVWYWA